MEVGEYIRFSDGSIIKAIEDEISYYEYILEEGHILKNDVDVSIIKHSKNIIDLIEEGDIVEIQNKLDGVKTIFDLNKYTIDIYKEQIKNESIKILSIVTKERFKEMEYRIDE